jgi:hypothetical protein
VKAQTSSAQGIQSPYGGLSTKKSSHDERIPEVSVKRLELLTNGLKGQNPETASPNQWPTLFA